MHCAQLKRGFMKSQAVINNFPPSPSNHPLPSTLVRHISPILKASPPLAYASRSPRWLATFLLPSFIFLLIAPVPLPSPSLPRPADPRCNVLCNDPRIINLRALFLPWHLFSPLLPPTGGLWNRGGIRRRIDWEASDSSELKRDLWKIFAWQFLRIRSRSK